MNFLKSFTFFSRKKVIEKKLTVSNNRDRPVATVKPAGIIDSSGVPRYPPIDSGISVATVSELVASQADLIVLLKRNLGLDEADFEYRYLQPIRRVAELINLLPATRDKHHTGAGGLFRFCLLLAVRSAQSAEGRIFAASEGIERRRKIEIAWRHAAFLTGLTCELFRPLTQMLIIDEKGIQWSPFVSPLTEWAKKNNSDRFFIKWITRDDARSTGNTLSSWAVNAVLGNNLIADLHLIKPGIVEGIFGVASGSITTADNSTLATLINDVRRKVIETDLQIAPTTYGKLTVGAHLEPYLIDSMRRLFKSGVWQINTKSSRCHYGSDGLFIAWRLGSAEMMGILRSENVAGIPSERETLADMMGNASIISAAPDGSWIHIVYPRNGLSNPIPCIKVTNPSSVLGSLDITPVKENLRASVQKKIITTDVDNDVSDSVSNEKKDLKTKDDGKKNIIQKNITVEEVVDNNAATKELEQKSIIDKKPKAELQISDKSDEVKVIIKEEVKKIVAPDAPPLKIEPPVKKANVVLKTGIPTVPDSDIDVDNQLDKDLLLELGAPLCREIDEWKEKWNNKTEPESFVKMPDGLGISIGLLMKSPLQMPRINEPLKNAGFLKITVVSGRERLSMSLPFSEGPQLGIVLKMPFLRKAGFNLE